MDIMKDITDRGDQYAKRLLIRKREQNQSPECYSKSLRRRISIMDAINKNSTTSQMQQQQQYSVCNPFEREFANLSADDEDQPYVSTWPCNEDDDAKQQKTGPESAEQTFCVEQVCSKSMSPPDANCNSIQYHRSSQFRQDMMIQDADTRMSIGAYFAARTATETNFMGELSKVDMGRSRSKVPDLLFGARVLEVIEPEVVDRTSTEPARSHDHQLTYSREGLNESVGTSFVSEDIRELEREIEEMHFQPDVDIVETPRRIYPSLGSVKRLSDKFTPKKQLFRPIASQENNTNDADVKSTTYTTEQTPKDPQEETGTFSTPMPLTTPEFDYAQRQQQQKQQQQQQQEQQQQHRGIDSMSFLRRNASFILSNLHVPRVMRRKPNLESTRKGNNSGGKTLSPMSQVGSTISTLTLPNTPSSPQTYEPQVRQLYRNNDATLPYEVENFLELALGDEQYNSTVTYAASDARDRTNSQINASELISESRSPIENRNFKVMRVPMTEPPKHSSTLNRTLTMYRTLTQRIKKKFRGSMKHEPQPLAPSLYPSLNDAHLEDNVRKLLEAADIQQTLIYQASKALDLCSSMREFVASAERVEYERVLALACLRKKALQEEISRLSGRRESALGCSEPGELTLKELSLQLREDVLRRQGGELVEWFIAVVSEGPTVWATHAVECPSSSPRLYFPGQLSIPGLTPGFRLSVRIYSMQLPKILYNHEDKYHTHGGASEHNSTTCPSPKNLLRRSDKKRPVISPKQYEIRFSGIKKSSFVLCGSLDLMLHDLNLQSPWPITGVPSKSVLHGTIDLKLTCRLQLSVSHAGFLTHGDEAGGLASWNRRWCVLEGHNLLFWNYPREQESKPPLYAIDLLNCVSNHIGPIDRSLCARPRTLLVETARRRSIVDRDSIVVECRSTFTVVRNLLSCDTHQDLEEWQLKLNHIVAALREWNIIHTDNDHLTTSGIVLS